MRGASFCCVGMSPFFVRGWSSCVFFFGIVTFTHAHRGRYYVHFRDGSFFFYGPPSLSKILIDMGKKQKRRRGKGGIVSISSVAFGKELDDFFVVRYALAMTHLPALISRTPAFLLLTFFHFLSRGAKI